MVTEVACLRIVQRQYVVVEAVRIEVGHEDSHCGVAYRLRWTRPIDACDKALERAFEHGMVDCVKEFLDVAFCHPEVTFPAPSPGFSDSIECIVVSGLTRVARARLSHTKSERTIFEKPVEPLRQIPVR
jgi:hypothetical protein